MRIAEACQKHALAALEDNNEVDPWEVGNVGAIDRALRWWVGWLWQPPGLQGGFCRTAAGQ
jgi:hypothetical protein